MSTDISCLVLCFTLASFSRIDICHGFAFHAVRDGLPNSLSIISIKKWRYRLGISNSVQGIWTEKHMLQGIVLLYVVDDFLPSKLWETCKMVLIWSFHIHPCQFLLLRIVCVVYVESRKMDRWSSSTPLQWERPPANLIIVIMPCPVHKFSDSHSQSRSLLLSVRPCSRYVVYMSEWFSLTAFLRTADIEVHIVHTSRVVCGVHVFVENYRAFQVTGLQI